MGFLWPPLPPHESEMFIHFILILYFNDKLMKLDDEGYFISCCLISVIELLSITLRHVTGNKQLIGVSG